MRLPETNFSSETDTDKEKEKFITQVNNILTPFHGDKSELIPILQAVQRNLGYLPERALGRIAQFVNIPECTVFGVATFYSQFKLVPTGKNVVRVCRGTACHIRKSTRILREVERHLDIKPGESTTDLEFSLETVACLGACALAPTMVVNNKVYGKVVESDVKKILSKNGEDNGI